MAACAKHFVGDGGTTNGTDEGNTEVSYKELVDIHMKAYPHAIARGVATIMASYNSWNGFKMHANKFLLTDVLKGQLGFKGFIISDWQGIDRISTPWGVNYTYSTELALNAGIDMVCSIFLLCAAAISLSVSRCTPKKHWVREQILGIFSMAGHGALQLHGLYNRRQAANRREESSDVKNR